MRVKDILKRFFKILNYLKINFFKNTFSFIALGLTDLAGIILLGLLAKSIKDFDKVQVQISSYFPIFDANLISLQTFILLVFLTFLFRSILHIFIIKYNTELINHSIVKIKDFAFTTYLNSRVYNEKFSEIKNVINNLNIRPEDIGKLFTKSLTLFKEFFVFICVTSLLFIINFKLLILTFIIFFGLGLIYFYLIKSRLSFFSEKLNKEKLNKLKFINSVFLIFKEIKFGNITLNFRKKSKQTDQEIANISTMVGVFNHLPQIIIETSIIFLICLTFFLQLHFAEIDDNFLALMVVLLVGAYRIKPFFVASLEYFTSVKLAENSINAIYDLIKINYKVISEEKEKNTQEFNIKKLEFKNVSYDNERGQSIFDKVNLKIERGEKILICGASGAGKSTFLNLLLKFKFIKKGEILINEKNINKFNYEEYLSKISYLQQEPSIFDATLSENITLNKNEDIDIEKLKKVINFVNLNNFLKKNCNNDLNFNLKELGTNLSGGEKQRITLARTLYLQSRDLIILDEPVKSLDNNNQLEIIENILKYFDKKTVIILSHNIHISKFFTKVYSIKNSNIFLENNK